MFSAYKYILSFSCRGQGELPEPPPKKQKVAHKKGAATDKKAADTSAPSRAAPTALDERRSKRTEDKAQETASASEQHVSDHLS